ncbi:MAG TPA: HIT family protein [Chloroflexia bacterium]|nr:HIT family protein [Chloroflexia bacterium]
MDCYSCKSISGEKRISPGPTIHEGEYWLVEHAYPCGMVGWLVIILKRHAEALHELSLEESRELGKLQHRVAIILHQMLDCEKEYVACFGEAAHFNHIHFHVIPKPRDLPDELRGPGIFRMLKVTDEEGVPRNTIKEFCESLKHIFKAEE